MHVISSHLCSHLYEYRLCCTAAAATLPHMRTFLNWRLNTTICNVSVSLLSPENSLPYAVAISSPLVPQQLYNVTLTAQEGPRRG